MTKQSDAIFDALILFFLNTLLLITHLRAIETLVCRREMSINKVYFLRFRTKYDTRFSKYGIELIVALSSTNDTKTYTFTCPN